MIWRPTVVWSLTASSELHAITLYASTFIDQFYLVDFKTHWYSFHILAIYQIICLTVCNQLTFLVITSLRSVDGPLSREWFIRLARLLLAFCGRSKAEELHRPSDHLEIIHQQMEVSFVLEQVFTSLICRISVPQTIYTSGMWLELRTNQTNWHVRILGVVTEVIMSSRSLRLLCVILPVNSRALKLSVLLQLALKIQETSFK